MLEIVQDRHVVGGGESMLAVDVGHYFPEPFDQEGELLGGGWGLELWENVFYCLALYVM